MFKIRIETVGIVYQSTDEGSAIRLFDELQYRAWFVVESHLWCRRVDLLCDDSMIRSSNV